MNKLNLNLNLNQTVVDLNADSKQKGRREYHEYQVFRMPFVTVGIDDCSLDEWYDSPRCIASAYKDISIKTLGGAKN